MQPTIAYSGWEICGQFCMSMFLFIYLLVLSKTSTTRFSNICLWREQTVLIWKMRISVMHSLTNSIAESGVTLGKTHCFVLRATEMKGWKWDSREFWHHLASKIFYDVQSSWWGWRLCFRTELLPLDAQCWLCGPQLSVWLHQPSCDFAKDQTHFFDCIRCWIPAKCPAGIYILATSTQSRGCVNCGVSANVRNSEAG